MAFKNDIENEEQKNNSPYDDLSDTAQELNSIRRSLTNTPKSKGHSDKEQPDELTSDLSNVNDTKKDSSSSSNPNTTDNNNDISTANDSNNSSTKANSSQTQNTTNAGTESTTNGTASATSSAAGNTAGTAGSSAGGTAAGSATSGAATGAAAGSAVPIAGTAIGAAVGAAGSAGASVLKSKKGADTAGVAAPVAGEAKDKTMPNNDNTTKTVVLIISLVIIIFVLFFQVLFQINKSIVTPAMIAYEAYITGKNFIEDLGKDEPTFGDVSNYFVEKIKSSLNASYYTVCKAEVEQIAKEKDYDIDLTMESYNNTTFPYILDGDNCNVNYSELINLISMEEDFLKDYTTFDLDEYLSRLTNIEFLRTLYNLEVEEAYKYEIKHGSLPFNATASVDSNGTVTINYADGTSSTKSGSDAEKYRKKIKYGKVTVSHYSLLEIFDYLNLDPYSDSCRFPDLSNYDALKQSDYFTREFDTTVFWGCDEMTELTSYKRITGKLTIDNMDIFGSEINDNSIFSDTEVYMDIPLYHQYEGGWEDETYGEGTIRTLGCCLCSFSMIADYFTQDKITPHTINEYIKKTDGGSLNRKTLSKHYGFSETTSAKNVNVELIMSELSKGHPIIIHIRPGCLGTNGTYGHFVVLHGYTLNGNVSQFYVRDPGHKIKTDTYSMNDLINACDLFWAYTGNRKISVNMSSTSSSISIDLSSYSTNIIQDIENGYYSAEDYAYMAAVMSSECSSNSEGAIAVGYCVLNRCSKNNMSVKEAVTSPGQFASPWYNYLKKPANDICSKAAVAVLKNEVPNPIGDCYYFFGSFAVTCYKPGTFHINVGGNIYYKYWGDVHTKHSSSHACNLNNK